MNTPWGYPDFDAHEALHFVTDAKSGLRAIIAMHSTHLGPAAGGTRLWTYADDADALTDALRLSRGMSYKNAMAGLPLGGGKAVVLARFVPIVRTFLPFVAGAAEMTASSFLFYNIMGGIGWVTICLGAGFLFGNVPVIKDNFTLVTIGIVIVSILPMVFEVVKHRRRRE